MTDAASLVLVANAADGAISTFRFDGGALERVAVTPGLTGCSTFAVDAARGLVYAGVKGDPPAIVTLALDRTSGSLSQLSRFELPDKGVNYLALARGGTALLGASYHGGYGIVCPVDGGTVGDPVARIAYAHLHSVLPSPDDRFAYFVSLGDDLVAQYALGEDLALTPLEPPTVAAPSGSGPRHLVIDDEHGALYVVTEFSGEVLHYRRDAARGVLSFVGAANAVDPRAGLGHSALGADPRAEHLVWGADLHGAGDRLWASERTESTLAAVGIGPGGAVTGAASFTVTEPQPRGFAVSPDGRFLVAAGERSGTLSLYRIDGDRLALLQRAESGAGANWVRFV